jgi:L-asparagine oxygenase
MLLHTDRKTKKHWEKNPETLTIPSIDDRVQKDWGLALESLSIPCNDGAYEILLANAPQIAREFMPPDLLQGMLSIKQPFTCPYRVLSNLPCDSQLTEVPTDGKRPSWKKSWVSEGVLIGIAGALGLEPLSYLQEKEGLLVHEVAPIPGQERQLSNSGKVSLGFHTDHAILHRRYRPEFLMLIGLVNPDRIPTLIACLDDALKVLEPHFEYVLRQPRFRIELPDSVLVWNGKKLLSEWKPMLTTGSNGEMEFAGNLHSVRPMDKEATRALNALVDALSEVVQEIVLEPGTLVLFDNHRCLHARPSLKRERWLQRLFCRHSLIDLHQASAAVAFSSYVFDMQALLLE